MIRPSVRPSSSRYRILVFGQRGHLLVQAAVDYAADVRGQEVVISAILSPSLLPRQRRHLGSGVMLESEAENEQKVVNFLSWWKGRWGRDTFELDPKSELDFLIEGLPRARGAGIHVEVDPSITEDMMSTDKIRVTMEVVAKSDGLLVQSDTMVGDGRISPFAMAEARRLKRSWLAHQGRAVSIDSGVDLDLLGDSAGKMTFVSWNDKSKLVGSLRLIRDSRIEDDARPILRRVLENEDEMRPAKSVHATMRDYQLEGMRWLVGVLSSGSGGVLADGMGLGKASKIDTPVLTKNGWQPIGSLVPGDFVYGSDGELHKVTGVFPQGIKPVFRVTFNDGSSTTCCEEHLWYVQSPKERSAGKTGRVLSLKDIVAEGLINIPKGRTSGNRKHFIPVVQAINFKKKEFEVDPYAIGAIMANGCTVTGTPAFTGSQEQLEELFKCLPDSITTGSGSRWTVNLIGSEKCRNPLTTSLKKMGLYGKVANSKFVPQEYLFGSIEQRLSLLQGFMDNDGTVAKDGIICEYNTVSPQLAKDIMSLVRSLGGIATLTTRIPSFTYKGERKLGQMDHRIRISMPPTMNPFRIKSKAERYKPRTKYLPARAFEKVEPEGEAECVCISVDSPDRLYVVEDFILTHNTLQIISSFAKMKESDPSYRAIVFAPKSLMGNWQNEFTKFAPSVQVLVWDGNNRKKYADLLSQVDVVVCSYDTYKRDQDLLNRQPFHAAFFDEAHTLKNPDTGNHKAAHGCLAPVRVAATGTPVENKLQDLWALYRIACPGLLPPLREFNERIVRPFRSGDPTAVQVMAEQIKPFILRRTKEQVLKDLPSRVVVNRLCPMTDVQESFYREASEQAREEKAAALASNNRSALQAVYFRLLTRLRQIATDPRLADPVGRYRADDSGKILTLRGMMDELDTDDQCKVLIFSQWVEELQLVKQELEARGQKFSYLTGETKNRDEQVHNFQTKPDIRYFLLGLKAGGVGLNITAADTVIIMDPWWNPASENQAIDRAHRFGQMRNVTAYRMIAQGTLEEAICDMKEIKQAISDGVLDDKELPNQVELASSLIG